jgi:hypothetical protein
MESGRSKVHQKNLALKFINRHTILNSKSTDIGSNFKEIIKNSKICYVARSTLILPVTELNKRWRMN